MRDDDGIVIPGKKIWTARVDPPIDRDGNVRTNPMTRKPFETQYLGVWTNAPDKDGICKGSVRYHTSSKKEKLKGKIYSDKSKNTWDDICKEERFSDKKKMLGKTLGSADYSVNYDEETGNVKLNSRVTSMFKPEEEISSNVLRSSTNDKCYCGREERKEERKEVPQEEVRNEVLLDRVSIFPQAVGKRLGLTLTKTEAENIIERPQNYRKD